MHQERTGRAKGGTHRWSMILLCCRDAGDPSELSVDTLLRADQAMGLALAESQHSVEHLANLGGGKIRATPGVGVETKGG